MKINIGKKEKIEKALNVAQRGANARLVDYDSLQDAIERAEGQFARFELAKKHQIGSKITLDTHCKYSNSSGQYKSAGTIAVLIRGASSWFLTSIERNTTFGYEGKNTLVLTELARKAIFKKLESITI